MNGRVQVVLVMLMVTTLVLFLTVTEAVVVAPHPPTHAPDLGNCSETVKLVPVLRLVTPSSSRPSPTLDTLQLPHTTTQPLLYTQPHGTTPPTAHPTTTQHPQQPIPPTTTPPSKTTLPIIEKHTLLLGTLKDPQELKKRDPDTLEKTGDSFTTDKNKHQISLQTPKSASFPSSYSSSYSYAASPPPDHVTIPFPTLPQPPQHTSTLSPLPPTLPLPTVAPSVPSTTPTVMFTLQEVGERLKRLLGQQIPQAITSGWAQEFQRPYVERMRAVNHEIVDKVLQAEYEEYEPASLNVNASTCYLPESRLARLYHRRTLLLLLLQALPQSLEEVEEAARDPAITDYIFRPEKKAVFDVYGCRQCYALDAGGVCREMFFCKDGQDVFSRSSRGRPILG